MGKIPVQNCNADATWEQRKGKDSPNKCRCEEKQHQRRKHRIMAKHRCPWGPKTKEKLQWYLGKKTKLQLPPVIILVTRSKLSPSPLPTSCTPLASPQQRSSGTEELVLRVSPLLLAARRPHPLNTHVNDTINPHSALQVNLLAPRHPHLVTTRLAINPRQLRVDAIPAELAPLLRIPPAHFARHAPVDPPRAATEGKAVLVRAVGRVVGRGAEEPSLGGVGMRTAGAGARGGCVVGAGGGGAAG